MSTTRFYAIFTVVSLSLLAPLGLAGCDVTASPADRRADYLEKGAHEIVIAAVWPWQSRSEIRFAEGLDLAAEEINAAGGINGRMVRVRKFDDQGSVNTGLLLAQQLADDPQVAAVIGHLQSYVSVPAAAIYEAGGLLMLSPTSTSTELTSQGYQLVFRAIFSDGDAGRRMAEYAAEQGYRRVAIYYVRNPYGRALANAFEERAVEVGAQVVARASYEDTPELNPRTFDDVLNGWEHLELDALFVAGQVPRAGALIASARAHGIKVPILGSDAMSSSALSEVGGATTIEGTIVPAPFHPSDARPEVQRFVSLFQQHYGMEPDPGAALAYDALHVLVKAMREANSAVPARVAEALRTMSPVTGATGELGFDERGDRTGTSLVLLVARNGVFEYAGSAVPQQRGQSQ